MTQKSDMNAPLVSICMPAYNAAHTIEETIKSIFGQTYDQIELIIVNDGSTDNTLKVLQTIKDERLQIIDSVNEGQSAAANRAFNASSGELIKFMDADDLLSEDFIRSQVVQLGNDGNAVSCASWGRFYENDLSTFKLAENIMSGSSKPIEWLASSMYDKYVMLQCALWLIPRPILDRAGLWNEKLSLINDFEFFIRILLHAGEIRYAPNAILFYRSGLKSSLSGLKSRAGAQSAFEATSLGTGYLLNTENTDRIRKIAADCFQNFVFEFYPHYPDLVENAKLRIKQLGGSRALFPAGGYTRILSLIIGWKSAKRVKLFLTGRAGVKYVR
jgi:glycosyltransferase involved in cell wall biosynthesis